MKPLVPQLAAALHPHMLALTPTAGGRPSTKAILEALTKARPVIENWCGGPVVRRYSGCPEGSAKSYRKSGREFRVLEYLWDFSLSRYAIPQAIEDPRAKALDNGKFELLLVGESELGTSNEICRDLLKLLEARTSLRCLVYRRPRRQRDRDALEGRRQSKQHAAQNREQQREHQHRKIDSQVIPSGGETCRFARARSADNINRPKGDEYAEGAAENAEHHTLS